MAVLKSRTQVAAVLVAVAVLLGLAAVIGHFRQNRERPPTTAVPTDVPAIPPPPATPEGRAPDLPALAAGRGAGTRAPTAADLADDARIEAEQVAAALRELQSPDPAVRLGAVQQLGAYPSAEAERRLAAVLAGDAAAEVRIAAAASLLEVKTPQAPTVSALLTAAAGHHPETRAAALETLEGYLGRLKPGTAAARQIVQGLRSLARSKALDPEERQALKDWLRDFGG